MSIHACIDELLHSKKDLNYSHKLPGKLQTFINISDSFRLGVLPSAICNTTLLTEAIHSRVDGSGAYLE